MPTITAVPLLSRFMSVAWGSRQLLVQMTRREVVGRYQGSLFGMAWSFFHPILMLCVYTLVFSGIFKMRWNSATETSTTSFALVLFAGLLVHALFSECLSRAPGLIVGNPSYVKKVVFPLEILPMVTMGAALFHAGVSLVVLLLAHLLFIGLPPWTVVFFPVVLAPLLLLTLGLSWMLAAIGVYVRDVSQIVGVAMSVLLFLSPVFFPISAIPERFRWMIMLNPLTLIIEQGRDVLLWGRLPNFPALGIYAVLGAAICWLGYWGFEKSRRGFADVL